MDVSKEAIFGPTELIQLEAIVFLMISKFSLSK
jgi:hypothetical protein